MAERALVAKAPVLAAAPTRSAAARVRPAADAFEREADRVADSVMSGRGDARPRRPLPRLLSTVHDSVAGQGRGLDVATRTFMESRFGYDFGRVRVHTDERAAASARGVQALAYTSGASIVFSEHAYSPHSVAGQRLLAHELTHIVQQASTVGLLHGIQRAPGPWYQEAIDRVGLSKQRMNEQAKRGELVMAPPYYDVEKALLELCEAVDAKKSDDVPKKIDALLKVGLWVHLQILSRSLLTELTARMYEMGLEADAERLRKAYAAEDRFGPYNDDIYGSQRKVDFLTRLVAGATAGAKWDSPDTVATSMHRFVRAYVALRDEFLEIDMEMVEHDRQSPNGWKAMRPGMTHVEFYEAVRGQIALWQRGLSTFEQGALDTARKDLESPSPAGTGAALLKALRVAMVGELKAALFPKDPAQNIAGESFAITHTEMGTGKGSISDEFATGKESRKLPITTYRPDQDWARELYASLAQSYRVRLEQLDVLGRVYGVVDALEPEKTFGETMAKAAKAKDNADTIRNMSGGRLRLDSDDDWRVFLLQKFNDLTNPQVPVPATTQGGGPAPAPTAKKAVTKAEALHDIVDLLFAYLRAFTVHARFTNIYDVGETSYINRPFPRALTGQLVHDCGVYALRAAYMLSLVRNELGLRFQFVVLPVHVSLVITSDPKAQLPSYVIENDQFTEISANELAERRKKWDAFKDPTTGAAPAGNADDEQFIGELASADFIRRVDMPFKVSDVPAAKKDVKDAKAEQKQLWAYYQRISTEDVFGPSSKKKDDPNYLFHLHYLELTEKSRALYNEAFVPFWNKTLPDLWDALQARLAKDPKQTDPKAKARTKIEIGDLLDRIGEYRVSFDEAAKPVKTRYDNLESDNRRLSERLRSDPGLAKAGVRLSVGARANMFWKYYWELHKEKIDDYETALIGRADNDEELTAVTKALDPPWIPREEKKLTPVE